MLDGLIAVLLVGGSLFMLLAAIGIVRFPDMLLRMHASAKAASFGTLLMLIGVAIFFDKPGVTWEAALVVAFIFLTTPIASHMIGRAAHLQNIPLWGKMSVDEFRDARQRSQPIVENKTD